MRGDLRSCLEGVALGAVRVLRVALSAGSVPEKPVRVVAASITVISLGGGD